MQDLAELLVGSGSELRVPLIGGGEVKIDRKGLNKIKNAEQPEEGKG